MRYSAAIGDTEEDVRRRTARAIIFLHIPKTAGSTLRRILLRQFPASEIYVPGLGGRRQAGLIKYIETGIESPRRVPNRNRRYMEQLRRMDPDRLVGLRLLIGHFWFGLHTALPQPSTYVTILRDPVERTLSLYHHRRSRHGLRMGIEDYVRTGRDIALDNEQTRRVWGGGGDRDVRLDACTPEMLERAKRNLVDHFAVVGLTERFDETIVLLSREFGWKRVAYVSRNVSRGRFRRDALEPEVLRAIEHRNRYDLQLYDFAQQFFRQRVEGRPSMAQEVTRLHRRNRLYRLVEPLTRPIGEQVRRARRVAGRLLRGEGIRGPR